MKQPIAWAYEATEYADKTYEQGWRRHVSFEKPFDETGGLRNVIPLYVTAAGFVTLPETPTPGMLEQAAHNLSEKYGPERVRELGEFARDVYAEFVNAGQVR